MTRQDGKSRRMDMLDWAAESFSPFPAQVIPDGQTSSPEGRNSRPHFPRRKLNPLFVEALMRWPTGLSGFDTSGTGSIRWLGHMRMHVLMLCSTADDQPEQGSFL